MWDVHAETPPRFGALRRAVTSARATARDVDASAPAVDLAGYVSADPTLHLLRRATYGPTAAAIASVRALGPQAWLERQLRPGAIADPACDAILRLLPLATASLDAVLDAARRRTIKQYSFEGMYQLGYAAVARAIWSERQLLELMVDFWSNHLNAANFANEIWYCRQDYDQNVIRKNALGSFSAMLRASASHPAMLTYLDNRYSHRLAPNENYARELLELHTVGRIYSEKDVAHTARLLCGLTVDWTTGRFRYDASAHDTAPVEILGFRHGNSSASEGYAVASRFLEYLAMHPATARNVATKLAVRFVGDSPPATLVAALTKAYLDNRTAVAPVLRALFGSAEFRSAAGKKARTPFEDVIATARTVGLTPASDGMNQLRGLYWAVSNTGQPPLACAIPTGYPDTAQAWASTAGVLTRWNAHRSIVRQSTASGASRLPGLAGTLLQGRPAACRDLIDALAAALFLGRFAAQHARAIAGHFGRTLDARVEPADPMLHDRFAELVTLMLDSPYFLAR